MFIALDHWLKEHCMTQKLGFFIKRLHNVSTKSWIMKIFERVVPLESEMANAHHCRI